MRSRTERASIAVFAILALLLVPAGTGFAEEDVAKSDCVSDNACFAPASDGTGVYCVTMAKKRSKAGK